MRILIATDAWSPQVNGVVRTLNALIAELRAMGHEVHVITPEGKPSWPMPLYREISLTGMSVAEALDEISAVRPDAIHIATEGLKAGLQFTTGFHTRFAEYAAARLPLPGVLGLGWRVLRHFHAPSRGVMVPTKSIGAELDRRGFENVRIWTRGVDRTLFHDYPRDHLDLPRPIVLYAGRLAVEKGIDDFMKLKVTGSKVLVGDGPERERLQRMGKDAHFLGFRHGEDYARTLAAADVMVFPSLWPGHAGGDGLRNPCCRLPRAKPDGRGRTWRDGLPRAAARGCGRTGTDARPRRCPAGLYEVQLEGLRRHVRLLAGSLRERPTASP